MFMVVNKDKVISYIVSVSIVAILFVMPYLVTQQNNEIVKTSSNIAFFNQSGNNDISNNTLENEYNITGLN